MRGKKHRGRVRGTCHRQRASKTLEARVQEVGPERFGILAVDSAKRRFAVLLADFYGRTRMGVLEVDNTAPALDALVARLKACCAEEGLKDLVVAMERTGRYHMPIRQVLGKHWDVQIIHPFATKQLRQPADPGNKTDPTDLQAIVRAAIVGFGRREEELPAGWVDWRLVSREREALVRQRAWMRVRLHMRIEALMPGYPALFGNLWTSPLAVLWAQHYGSASAVVAAGESGLRACGRKAGALVQARTVAKVLQWAAQAAPADPGAATAWRLLGDQIGLLRPLEAQIEAYEREFVVPLVQTPFVLLVGIPGINVVSAASYGAELGPIEHYVHPKKITGRAGLYPSRYQSDETDLADGPLVGHRNARLRDAILEIAHNLLAHNEHVKAWAAARRLRGWPEGKVHIAVASKFVRISYWMLAGRTVFEHPCLGGRDALVRKLYHFARAHHMSLADTHTLLHHAAQQLPATARHEEARALVEALPRRSRRGGEPQRLGDILRDIIAQLAPGLDLGTERSPVRPCHPVEGPSLNAQDC